MKPEPNTRKDPFLAVALSMVFTGAGQIYNGHASKALTYVLLFILVSAITGASLALGLGGGSNLLLVTFMRRRSCGSGASSTPAAAPGGQMRN